ncbi:MAG: lytic transglycosylase domain-containing protein, partial [Myxococcota bacterium]|nr:lytic transglycosylase domain-containing protein [Myxococcota bacterium]
LEGLSEADKSRPELRYLRARVALAREDAAAALPLLDGLESALPLLAEDIGYWRAQAKLAVGSFVDAGEWLSARAAPAPQLDAARAFERAKDPRRARLAVDRVLASSKRTRAQEAEARALRVRIVDSVGDTERGDARWLATSGSDVAPVDGLALVARLDAKHPLSAQEFIVRARVLADAGRTDEALHAIDSAANAPGGDKVSALERARARGTALFRARGRWSEAARTLAECAGAGGPHAAEDAFHAARALSRADRDEEAIRAYEDVQRRFPKSTWADDAAFFVSYLRMLHGEWLGCAGGFEAYLHSHTKGEHDRDARRYGGLCKLLGGDAKGARAVFERLIDDVQADPVGSARMANMAALAALRDGDRTHAVALWTDVARSRPLSWPALVARARLAQAGAPIPPAFGSPLNVDSAIAPLNVIMPPPSDLLERLGLDEDAETALRDREGAIIHGAEARASEALCAAYGQLGRARRRYQIAQTLPSTLFATAPEANTRWAWECAFPSPYSSDVAAAEAGESLSAGLIWAVMRQESAFDTYAVSPAHAVGLMQLLPETARTIADELSLVHDDARLTSPPFAIRIAARFLRKLLDRFHDEVPLAVAAYNGGADSVERWLSRAPGMQLDTFVERIPFDETRDYVARVMGNLARYGYLARGNDGVPDIGLDLKGNKASLRSTRESVSGE